MFIKKEVSGLQKGAPKKRSPEMREREGEIKREREIERNT